MGSSFFLLTIMSVCSFDCLIILPIGHGVLLPAPIRALVSFKFFVSVIIMRHNPFCLILINHVLGNDVNVPSRSTLRRLFCPPYKSHRYSRLDKGKIRCRTGGVHRNNLNIHGAPKDRHHCRTGKVWVTFFCELGTE